MSEKSGEFLGISRLLLPVYPGARTISYFSIPSQRKKENQTHQTRLKLNQPNKAKINQTKPKSTKQSQNQPDKAKRNSTKPKKTWSNYTELDKTKSNNQMTKIKGTKLNSSV